MVGKQNYTFWGF